MIQNLLDRLSPTAVPAVEWDSIGGHDQENVLIPVGRQYAGSRQWRDTVDRANPEDKTMRRADGGAAGVT